MITYFIRAGEFVKIGRTKNLQKRIEQLRVAFPHDPVLLNACDLSEWAAHSTASSLTKRLAGEWFEANLPLLSWIRTLPTTTNKCASIQLKSRTPHYMVSASVRTSKRKTKKTKHNPMNQQQLAEQLTKQMASVGFTDETLSSIIDYPPDTIYRWRTGKVNPSSRAKHAILQAITKRREA